MASLFSGDRIRCADYLKRHKKVQYQKKGSGSPFVKVGVLAAHLEKHYENVSQEHFLCKKCHTEHLRKCEEAASQHQHQHGQVPPDNDEGNGDNAEEEFVESETELSEINKSAGQLNVTPIKKPYNVKVLHQTQYLLRKRKELQKATEEHVSAKLAKIYKVPVAALQTDSSPDDSGCGKCEQFSDNIQTALTSVKCYNEKVKLLTLLPGTMSRNEILSTFPVVTKHMVDKARSTIKEKGVYSEPDPYAGHPLSPQAVRCALAFYLEDELDCSRQSANKKDAKTVIENNEKVVKVKRYLTRSIQEIYRIFTEKYPHMKVGRTSFYALRPPWVIPHPQKNSCLCIYCENFQLCVTAIKHARHDIISVENLKQLVLSLVVCDTNSQSCAFQECAECPGEDGITCEAIGLEDTVDEDITFALWEGNDLIKKTSSLDHFIGVLAHWAIKAVVHLKIKDIQRQGIQEEKHLVKNSTNHLFLHCDFAENWTAILPNEIQSYHWQNPQVSIFTAVCYFNGTTRSFGMVSDDRSHDSAHALLAFTDIEEMMKEEGQIERITILSDGAASHFKNRYQLFELTKASIHKKWIFTATGHGKGPCDGVGGALKHIATNHNLSRGSTEVIKNASDFADTVQKCTSSITVKVLPKTRVEEFRQRKLQEWQCVPAVRGIQKSHVWSFSAHSGEILISKTFNHTPNVISFNETMKTDKHFSETPLKFSALNRGTFIACVYNSNWWVAEVTEVCTELEEVTVNFLLPHGPSQGYKFPDKNRQKEHSCSVPLRNILKIICAPVPTGSSGRLHAISREDTVDVERIFSLHNYF